MLARTVTHALVGLDPRRVEVEVDVRDGIPGLTIVGLADRACQEARERLRSGVRAAELEWPRARITVNLAPAGLKKEGSGFDLPIALALAAASGQLPYDALAGLTALGELALDGRVRPVGGVLAAAEGARSAGLTRILCASESAPEAALAGIEPVPLTHLAEAVAFLRGQREPPAYHASNGHGVLPPPPQPDLADVRGHERARRALEIAAAGSHNLLLAGPPGTGKTMLARRLPGILPPLDDVEALEVTRIHSVAGLLEPGRPLVTTPPFRAPHHGASTAAIVGGGSGPRPGEATLAHRGVLLLDELAEFARPALEALRQPLEDGVISVARVEGRATFPARFQLVATTKHYLFLALRAGSRGGRPCQLTHSLASWRSSPSSSRCGGAGSGRVPGTTTGMARCGFAARSSMRTVSRSSTSSVRSLPGSSWTISAGTERASTRITWSQSRRPRTSGAAPQRDARRPPSARPQGDNRDSGRGDRASPHGRPVTGRSTVRRACSAIPDEPVRVPRGRQAGSTAARAATW